eukprot:133523-Rhodomonas_salina.2
MRGTCTKGTPTRLPMTGADRSQEMEKTVEPKPLTPASLRVGTKETTTGCASGRHRDGSKEISGPVASPESS